MTERETDTASQDKVLQVVQEAALLAGAKIRQVLSSTQKIQTKSSSTDLVTETDKQCEALVIDKIQRNFPSHKIIGEESSGSDKYELTDEPTFTIDPIDGTTNFVHRLKLSCVIISHIVNKIVCVAVIYDPYADELFYAVKGKGAYLKKGNQEAVPIHVSTTESLKNSVISMDPGYGRDRVAVERYCAIQTAILTRSARNLRVIGCTGLNMAWVSCGRLDGGFEEGSWDANRGPKIWDFAAGRLLVSEAGGITRDLERPLNEEGPLNLMGRSFFCAANATLGKEILEGIAEGRSKSSQEG